jgi:hypothetical protein
MVTAHGSFRNTGPGEGVGNVKRRTVPSDEGFVQIALKPMLVLCCAALLVSGVSAGAATAQSRGNVTLRIFDPRGRVHALVTLAGIVRSKTHVVVLPSDQTGSGNVSLAFTKAGWTSFCSLTRGLAHVGSRLHRLQSDALKVDGRIYSRGYIEYRMFPNGLCVKGSAPRILFSMKLTTARSLAGLIRN